MANSRVTDMSTITQKIVDRIVELLPRKQLGGNNSNNR